MRILQVVHGFAPESRGGTESYVLEMTLALRRAGHAVSVLAGSVEPRTPAALEKQEIEGIPVTRLHRSGLFVDNWEKSYDPTAAALFAGVLDAARPDVVHVHHWIRLTRNLVEITASRGIPAVVTLHDAMASCPRVFRVREETLCHRPLSVESCLGCVPRPAWLADAECGDEIEAYRRDFARELDLASAIIVPSKAHQEFLSRELSRPAASFRVVPHGRLERDRPEPPPAKKPGRRLRIGHWGHLEPYKGYHLLLEALQSLAPEERGRVEVVCFGVASDPAYRRRLDELGAGLKIKEVGRFAPRDLAGTPFDLAVLPSIASESFSFVLDEAFELGVPALVADRGALAERIGRAGATFAAESAESLAARLREVLANPGLLSRWTAAIPALLSMDDHAGRLARIYAGAVRHGREPTPPDPAVTAARLASLGRRLELRTQALDEATALATGRADELRRKEEDIGRFQSSVGEYRRTVAEKEQESSARASALAGFQTSVEEHARLLAEKAEEAAALRDALAKKEGVVAGFERSIREHAAELERRDRTLAGFEESVREHEAELEKRDRELAGFERSIREHKAELEKRDRALAGFERSIREHKAELERRDRALAGFEDSTKSLRGEVERLAAEIEGHLAERAKAEAAWKGALEEHGRSVKLHSETLRARERELAEAQSRRDALAGAVALERRKVEQAVVEARSLAQELEQLQAAASSARDAQARAEADASSLDLARAEEQRQVSAWRDRAIRSESSMRSAEASLRSTSEALASAARDLDELRRRAALAEDDARRIDELASRGAAALALPDRSGDRVSAAADLVGAVVEQQERLGDLRSWLRERNGAGRAGAVLEKLEALPRRLRILIVIHDFLPYHAAGSEVYTFQLAKALGARNDVELLFCENCPDRPQYQARRGAYEGIPFTEIVHHAAWPDFRATWRDPRMDARFDEVLDRFRPDVVHLQHTKFFGVGILGRAARRGIPIVYTLHEYMLLCARDGQMLREDLSRCEQPVLTACTECLAPKLVESGPVSRGVQRLGRGLARVLPGRLKELGSRIERRAAVRHATPVGPERARALVEERNRGIRAALAHVGLFLAPSAFLRRTFVESGFVKPERIVVSRYGQDLSRFADAPRRRRPGPLRVGYLGTIAAYKGVDVLVDALNRLGSQEVEGLIHGVTEFFPDFAREVEGRITNPRVRLLGRYENADVGRILSEMDVLVVPSVWWENSPITIHEAFLAGVPVVASDQGGMAELVQDGVNGFLFRIGDAADLARVLMRFVADPGLAERLRPRRGIIRDIREDALWTEVQYRRLIAEKVGAR